MRDGLLSLEVVKGQTIDGTRIEQNIFYSTRKNDKIVFQGLSYYGTTIYLRDAKADRNLYWNRKSLKRICRKYRTVSCRRHPIGHASTLLNPFLALELEGQWPTAVVPPPLGKGTR